MSQNNTGRQKCWH